MRLILLEDHEDSASAVTAGLRLSTVPYEVRHFSTLKAAIVGIERESFDAALIDLGLPDASGSDAPLAIQALAPQLPIVVMTGENFERLGVDLIDIGIQDFLQKGDISVARIDQSLRMACERKRHEEELRAQASYDHLTGLMNRKELDVQLRRTLSNADRQGIRAAVLAIDLDGFKQINDSHGHPIGDAVLQQSAIRLQEHIRAGDCAARVGGDEFVVVLAYLPEPAGATATARKICQRLNEPIVVAGNEYRISASVGVALFPDHGREGKRLCEYADEAMYAVKRNGKDAVRIYDAEAGHPAV